MYPLGLPGGPGIPVFPGNGYIWGTVAGRWAPTTLAQLGSQVIDSTFFIENVADNSKHLAFSLGGMTTGKTLTISISQSATQTLAIPNVGAGDTIATLNLGQTFTGINTFSNSQDATALGTGAVVLSAGGLSVNSQLRIGGNTTTTGTLTSTTASANTLSVSSTAGNGLISVGSQTGGNSAYRFQIAGSTVIQMQGSTTGFNIVDAQNSSWVLFGYTPGASTAGYVTFAGTKAATSTTAAGVVMGGGLGVAGYVISTGLGVGVAPTANIPINVTANYAGQYTLQMANTNTGTTGEMDLSFSNGTSNFLVRQLSTGFTTNGVMVANSGGLYETGASLFIVSASGGINVATGGTTSCWAWSSGGLATSSIAGTNTFTITSTGGNANLNVNGQSGGQSNILFSIAGANKYEINTSAAIFGIYDQANSWYPMEYTAGAVSAGVVAFAGTLAATSSTAAAVTYAGGVGISGALWLGSTLDTSATQTGALVVAGGASFGKSICFGLVAAPSTLALGQIWQDSAQQCWNTNLGSSTANLIRSSIVTCLFTGKTLTAGVSFTTATSMIPSGIGTTTLPANFFTIGKTLRIRLTGNISNAGTGTVAFSGTIGAATVFTVSAIALTGSPSSAYFELVIDVMCDIAGSSGNLAPTGRLLFANGQSAQIEGSSIGSVTFNTTTSAAIALTMTCSVSAANNGFVTDTMTIEALN